MKKFIFKRTLSGLLTIWFIASATFFAMHAVPGNPLSDEKAVKPEIRLQLEKKYGLDKPLHQQYFIYLNNMMHGDFGISYTQKNRKVNDIIKAHFPVSAQLGVMAIIFALFSGVLFGALTAKYRNKWPDQIIMLLVVISISVPSFIIAGLVQLALVKLNQIFGVRFLPVAGWGGIQHMLAPSLILGLGTMAFITRLMRSSLLEIENADYIRTAKAKGLSPLRIFFKHQLRNAVLPVLTILGPMIAAITTGGFVVELVFAIPGLGSYFVEAVNQLDYTLIMGTTVFYGAFLVVMVLIVDILYGFVDPRIRVTEGSF